MPATGSVYTTDPVGPTLDAIVSAGSPVPPPISRTLWPTLIRASSIRPEVNGAKICAISDCGDAGHILLSKHVADDLEQYRQWRSHLHDLGECEVKHDVRV